MDSRTKNSTRNVVCAVGTQIVTIILGFISRAVFLRCLSTSYLGVNGLFTEFVSVFSLADLGLNSVMVYSFFKPLAENDKDKLAALTTYYQKIYRTIALVVASLGIAATPFLRWIINLDESIDGVYIYYYFFIAKVVFSYLFVYRVSVLNADQKNYIVSTVNLVSKIVTVILQILSLLLFGSYFCYLLLDVISIFVSNFISARISTRRYSFIKRKIELQDNEKKEIKKNIKAGFIYKLSSVLLNSTDNTIISVMLGTVVVGLYSNYGMVINNISVIINTAFGALNGSVGNLLVKEKEERRYEVFSILQLIGFIMSGITSVCVFLMMGRFINLWIGEVYILEKVVLVACILNCYFSIVLQPLWAFREGAGLFRKTKYVMVCTAVVNLILSVILCQFIGLAGVIFASVISRLVTYFWYEPILLFREYFGRKAGSYFLKHLYNLGLCVVIALIEWVVLDSFGCDSWLMFVVECICVLLSTTVLFIIGYFWQNDFKMAYRFFAVKIKQWRNNR